MTKILALDTSTDACSVALYLDGEIHEDFRIIPRQHTQQLLPMVEAMLAHHSVAVADLDALAFGRGPGSFAGIRIATGVTQGLAYAADLPVIPVSTLEAMALAAYEKEGASDIVAALDARMDEIYVASYNFSKQSPEVVMAEKVSAPAKLVLAEGSYLAVGSGWCYFDSMNDSTKSAIRMSTETYYPSAGCMLKIALPDWQTKAVAANEALPVYLRDEVAWKKKDQQ